MTKEQEQLVEDNLGLAHNIAKNFMYGRQSLTMDDLVQYGMIGLIQAAQTFDKSKDIAFSTYASTCIKNIIMRSIDVYDQMIRIPVHTQQQIRQATKDHDEESLCRLSPMIELSKAPYVVEVTSDPYENNEKHKRIIFVDPSPTPEEHFLQQEEKAWIHNSLTLLSDKERFVLEHLFGFHGKPLSHQAVGEMLGLSRERVRKIRETALRKMKRRAKREERISYG